MRSSSRPTPTSPRLQNMRVPLQLQQPLAPPTLRVRLRRANGHSWLVQGISLPVARSCACQGASEGVIAQVPSSIPLVTR